MRLRATSDPSTGTLDGLTVIPAVFQERSSSFHRERNRSSRKRQRKRKMDYGVKKRLIANVYSELLPALFRSVRDANYFGGPFTSRDRMREHAVALADEKRKEKTFKHDTIGKSRSFNTGG